MRSELVFAAEQTLPNRYSLCRVVSIATRKFHQPNTRVEETSDAVLRHIANASAGAISCHGHPAHEKHVVPACGQCSCPSIVHGQLHARLSTLNRGAWIHVPVGMLHAQVRLFR